jgi:outer membrane murein-binding lipoprotein Lpp
MKKLIVLVTVVLFAASLSGCATARKQKELETQGLKNQISVLESQVQSRDEEINSLKEQLTKSEQQTEAVNTRAKVKVVPEIKSRPNIKQIQISLVNAGYEVGTIDGKMGRRTKEAIKAFQKANNLTPDGKVGKKTWSILKDYYYKKIK